MPLAIKGFTVAILGGLGNSLASAAAGMLLGILESLSVSVLPAAYKDVIVITSYSIHYTKLYENGAARYV